MRATPTRGGGNAEGNAVSKILSGEHLTYQRYIWKIPEEN